MKPIKIKNCDGYELLSVHAPKNELGVYLSSPTGVSGRSNTFLTDCEAAELYLAVKRALVARGVVVTGQVAPALFYER